MAGKAVERTVAAILAHLEKEAARRPRARAFARGIRHAADEIRAGFYLPDRPAPKGKRARYNEGSE